jgi:hypothetical protein
MYKSEIFGLADYIRIKTSVIPTSVKPDGMFTIPTEIPSFSAEYCIFYSS